MTIEKFKRKTNAKMANYLCKYKNIFGFIHVDDSDYITYWILEGKHIHIFNNYASAIEYYNTLVPHEEMLPTF